MGWLEKFTSRSSSISVLASLPFVGLAGYEFWQLFVRERFLRSYDDLARFLPVVLSPLLVNFGTSLLLNLLNRFTYDSATIRRINDCRKSVEKRSAPSFPVSEREYLMSFKDILYSTLRGRGFAVFDRKIFAEYGRRNRRFPFLYQAALGYMQMKEYDEAFACLRDALELTQGKLPRLNFINSLDLAVSALCRDYELFCRPDSVRSHIMYSTLYLMADQRKSWYWSALAKEIAGELNHKLKKEVYVFDALLATAQKRSDEKDSWKDAFRLLYDECEPVRLGESRNPAWILKDEDKAFFSGSFVFKGNKDKVALENERSAALRLEEILGREAVAPEPLYITDEPFEGLYVYVMRFLSGELLAGQLKRGDYSGIGKVIPVLAKIAAKYPLDGLSRVDVEEKVYRKLSSVGLAHMKHCFAPVIADLKSQRFWCVNKDGHVEQWQMLDNPYIGAGVGVLDAEMKDAHPLLNEPANLFESGGFHSRSKKQDYVAGFVEWVRKESPAGSLLAGAYLNDPRLFRIYDNSAIFRTLCLSVAWTEPDRHKSPEEKLRVINNGLRAIDDVRQADRDFYGKHESEYEGQRDAFRKLRSIMPS